MQRRTFIKGTSALGLFTLVTPSGLIQNFVDTTERGLEEGFHSPPVSAYPQTWWHWMNGNVTRQGITLDLEAMKEIGLGGFQNFDAGLLVPKGPVVYLSEEWIALKKHAIKEAERLGLEFAMHNCPGWTSSGGPWITPELAMQQISWSEININGGRQVQTAIPQPNTRLKYYKDICVIAYPALPGENLLSLLDSVTTHSGERMDIAMMNGQNTRNITIKPSESSNEKAYLQFNFIEPSDVRNISFISFPVGQGPNKITWEASDDGLVFESITNINPSSAWNTIADSVLTSADLPSRKARHFRLVVTEARWFRQITLSGIKRLPQWRSKANFDHGLWQLYPTKRPSVYFDDSEMIDPDSVLDLTKYMTADGQLNWTAPQGDWTILRMGYTPVGMRNRSAPDKGTGLECGKYDPKAMEFHFGKMMDQLLPSLGTLAAKGRVGLLIDSYEVGMQNWTHGFELAFEQNRQYKLLPYLPAVTGRIVGSIERTESFLYDLRHTQAELFANNYHGKFAELCKQNNIISYTEPYNDGPMEEIQIGSRVDVNMGEFWYGLSNWFQNNYNMRRTVKLAASIQHINGKKLVGAEAFTAEAESSKWQEYPYAMKALGDKMYTQGLNRMIFHRFVHQPHPTAVPGMTMGPYGIHFDRTNTWWKPAKAWMRYLSRTQFLLQQGWFVADLLYFAGEEPGTFTKVNANDLDPIPPIGHDYDLINTETLLKRAKIQNGDIVLPDGMSYKIFVLQNYSACSIQLLRKIKTMIQTGMVMVGARPQKTPGLKDAGNKKEFDELTSQIWGGIDGTNMTHNSLGAGHVYWGEPLQDILLKHNIKPDLQISSKSGDAPINYIHRRTPDTDIYFIANQRRKSEELVCSFRIANKQPEFWDPVTGKITPVKVFSSGQKRITLPLDLGPCGSMCVIFRRPADQGAIQQVTHNGKVTLSTRPFAAVGRKKYHDMAGDFTMAFWAKPEIDIFMPPLQQDANSTVWTDHYAIFPPSGVSLYGEGHEAAGVTVGRNGIAIWTRATQRPMPKLIAKVPISGWSHIAVVYKNNTPAIFLNGKLAQQGTASGAIIHPGIGEAYLADGASFYNGDMTTPELFAGALSADRIQHLADNRPSIELYQQKAVEIATNGEPGLLFFQDGRSDIRDQLGQNRHVHISGISQPIALKGPWQVSFPKGTGAPDKITLPDLISLHHHPDDGVKYFSGTVTYQSSFQVTPGMLSAGKHAFLDLGRVEVMAEVIVNGHNLGVIWQRPYRVDITKCLNIGVAQVRINVTTLWPNRLIGDEQIPEMYKFSMRSGQGIDELPEWYKNGAAKPDDGRVTFTTYKHYGKDSPLTESGLIGPVVLRTAIFKAL